MHNILKTIVESFVFDFGVLENGLRYIFAQELQGEGAIYTVYVHV